MKRKTSLLISLLILSLCGTIVIRSGAVTVPVNENQIMQNITAAVLQFYYCRDTGKDSLENDIYTSDVSSYLSERIETQRHATELYNTGKENYSIDVKLLDKETIAQKNTISCSFQVIATFNYVDCDFDTTVSEVAKILYDCTSQKIVDFEILS